jgi:hypothetical protein
MSKAKESSEEPAKGENKPKCGIIMPIADNPDLGYPPGHWGQVRDLIITAAEGAGFDADMVSNDIQVETIHSTIIKNIYSNDVAVCDVSSRNPNVMFELGLRIASKKPVILIKDDVTAYSFDTQLIPHLGYRRDMRMYETLAFQKELQEKITTAYHESQQPGYNGFLGQFTSYTLAQIDEKELGAPEYIAQVAGRMQDLEDSVRSLTNAISRGMHSPLSLSWQQIAAMTDRWDTPKVAQRAFNPNTTLGHVLYDLYPDLTDEGYKKLSKTERATLLDKLIASKINAIQGLTRAQVSSLVDKHGFPPF